MLQRLKNFWNGNRHQQLTDPTNIGLYIFVVVVLAITWSGIKTVQANYELQKKISTLRQQNAVLKLQNENAALQNQYYQTQQYLELAARQDFGLAAPGEKVILIPKDVALKHINPNIASKSKSDAKADDNRSKVQKNMQDWRDFLLGRQLFED